MFFLRIRKIILELSSVLPLIRSSVIIYATFVYLNKRSTTVRLRQDKTIKYDKKIDTDKINVISI